MPLTMFFIMTRILGIYLCTYGFDDSVYPEEYRKMLRKTFYNRFQYLTIIGLYVTLFTLVLGIIIEILQKIFKIRNQLIEKIYKTILSVTLPIEILISITFWTLFFINPKLIVNETVYNACGVNLFNNLCMHVFPVLLLILELRIVDLERSNYHVLLLLVFSVFYYLFCKYISYTVKSWPYPFLDKVNELKRISFIAGITVLGIIIYEIVMLISFYMKRKQKTE